MDEKSQVAGISSVVTLQIVHEVVNIVMSTATAAAAVTMQKVMADAEKAPTLAAFVAQLRADTDALRTGTLEKLMGTTTEAKS